MKEIELLKQKIWFTCWCINKQDAYKLIDIIEKKIEALESHNNYLINLHNDNIW